jgi:hypothetical protein
MKLIIAILTAVFVALLCAFIASFNILYTDKNSNLFWYAFIMIFGNIIIPILLLTLLFSLIKIKLFFASKIFTFFITVAILYSISIIGLSIMTITSPNPDYSFLSGLTLEKFKARFILNYWGYMNDVIISAATIPLVYRLVEKLVVRQGEANKV